MDRACNQVASIPVSVCDDRLLVSDLVGWSLLLLHRCSLAPISREILDGWFCKRISIRGSLEESIRPKMFELIFNSFNNSNEK